MDIHYTLKYSLVSMRICVSCTCDDCDRYRNVIVLTVMCTMGLSISPSML